MDVEDHVKLVPVLVFAVGGCADPLPADRAPVDSAPESSSADTASIPDNDLRTKLILALEGQSSEGELVYRLWCTACHGASGNGTKTGPSLRERLPKSSPEAVVRVILEGEGDMANYDALLDNQEIADVAAYIWVSFGPE